MITKSTPNHSFTLLGKWGTDSSQRNTYKYYSGSSSISYDQGPRHTSDGLPYWKNCDHVKTNWLHPGWSLGFGQNRWNEAFAIPLYGPASWLNFHLPTSGQEELVSQPSIKEAAQGLMSDIEAGVPSSFLLFEDVAGGLISSSALAYNISALFANLVNLFGPKRSFRNVWQSLRMLSCADLGFKFGIKATTHDIGTCCTAVSNYTDWVRRNKALNSKPAATYAGTSTSKQTSRFVEEVRQYSSGWPTSAIPGTTAIVRTRQKQIQLKQVLHIQYPGNYFSRANYAIKSLGLDQPMSTIWAIIPMSFVVDYFVGVQSLATSVDQWLNTGDLGIREFGSAWLIQHELKLATADVLKYGNDRSAKSSTASIESSSFSRHPFGGSLFGYVRPSGFNIRRGVTCAELALQRR